MANYKTPGVYIEEISTLPASIAPVATAIPAFVGYTEDYTKNRESVKNKSVRITSLLEFAEIYGGPFKEEFSVTLTGDSTSIDDTSVAIIQTPSPYSLYYHVRMYFENGGGPCYIVSVDKYAATATAATIDKDLLKGGLDAVSKEDEVTLLVIPEAIQLEDADRKDVYDAMLTQCNLLQDRFSIFDVKDDSTSSVKDDGDLFRNSNIGTDYLKYGAAYYPALKTTLNFYYSDEAVAIADSRTGAIYASGSKLSDVLTDGFASGTITIEDNDKIDGDLFSINGETLMEGDDKDFEKGADSNATAEALQGAIDDLVDSAYSTSIEDNVITITATSRGYVGTLITLGCTKSGGGASVSGDTLTGGDDTTPASGTITISDYSSIDGASFIINDEIFIAGTDFEIGSTNVQAAKSLIDLLDTKDDLPYEYLRTSNVITITAKAVGDAGNSITLGYNEGGGAVSGSTLALSSSADKALYNLITKEIKKNYVELYPCAAMAGIYARVDKDRGVWKAPANVSVNMVKDPSVAITKEEQENLNVDSTSGKSINAIRKFAGKGIIVWGARTLAGNDNEWRYIPVRRLFIFIEESVKKATEFVVFEPNDAKTWLRTKAMIENFLITLWKEGALTGAKPENAFYVKIGLGETMTSLDILEGRMNIEIGLAAVRPAEFIVLKFSHKLQVS